MTNNAHRNFIQDLYTNVLQEVGNESSINYWQAQANAGISAASITANFIQSAQGEQVSSIIRLYETFFNRAPDSDGLYFWTNALNDSSLKNIATAFGNTPEFQDRFLNFNTAKFVEHIYNNFYDRNSDPAGKAFWTNAVDSGTLSRTDLALFFSESSEARASQSTPTRLAESYLVLRASGNPEPSANDIKILSASSLIDATTEKITSFEPLQDQIVAAKAVAPQPAAAQGTTASGPTAEAQAAAIAAATLAATIAATAAAQTAALEAAAALAVVTAQAQAAAVAAATLAATTAAEAAALDAAAVLAVATQAAQAAAVAQASADATAAAQLAASDAAAALAMVTADAQAAALVAQAAAVAAATLAATLAAEAAARDAIGNIYSLTVNADVITGTGGRDTFVGAYDGVPATDTFNANDQLNGSGGIDTFMINHFVDVAITPPDVLWTGISNIENMVMRTIGDGVQTIVTGTNFNNAFVISGVNFTTTTSGAGAINIDMSTFQGIATLNTTSVAGAQTIVVGPQTTTVNATSGAGAITIHGVGLSVVTAITSGAGAQTIGDAVGGGANLINVNATSFSGAQTITSTSNASNVTVRAESDSGAQTIVLSGAGNSTVTSITNTGTINVISTTGAGSHTIVAGQGSDTITVGSGIDTISGGSGSNTFNFGLNGSVIGVAMDIITDFKYPGSINSIQFGAATTALAAADPSALVAGSGAGSNVQMSAGGLITFAASDDNLTLKIAALQADVQLDLGQLVAMFTDSGNTYLYYSGSNVGNVDDQLIQLTGITNLTTITAGTTTTIV